MLCDTVITKKGPLARVWLAAHWEKKLSKTLCLQTDIENSVDVIIEDGMALRVSGQLLLGVCKIFSKKTRYLLEDCNDALMKIKMAFRPGMVDLPEGQAIALVSSITFNEQMFNFDITVPETSFDFAGISKSLQATDSIKKLGINKTALLAADIDMEHNAEVLPGILGPLSQPGSLEWPVIEPESAADLGDWTLDLQLNEDINAEGIHMGSATQQTSLEIEVGRDAVAPQPFEANARFGDEPDDSIAHETSSAAKSISDTSFVRRDTEFAASDGIEHKFSGIDEDSTASLPFHPSDFDAPVKLLQPPSDDQLLQADLSSVSAASIPFKDISTLVKASLNAPARKRRSNAASKNVHAPVDDQTELDAAFIKQSLVKRDDVLSYSVEASPFTALMAKLADFCSTCITNPRVLFPTDGGSSDLVAHSVLESETVGDSQYNTANEEFLQLEDATIYDSLDQSVPVPDTPVERKAVSSELLNSEFDENCVVDEEAFEAQTTRTLLQLKAMFQAQQTTETPVSGFQPLTYRSMLPKAPTRKQAAGCFYQLLYTSTKGYIDVKQSEPFGSICILPKQKLLDLNI